MSLSPNVAIGSPIERLTFEQAEGQFAWTDSGKLMLLDIDLFVKRSGGNEVLAAAIILENPTSFNVHEVSEAKITLRERGFIFNNRTKRVEKSGHDYLVNWNTPWIEAEDKDVLRLFCHINKYDLERHFKRPFNSIRLRYYNLLKMKKATKKAA